MPDAAAAAAAAEWVEWAAWAECPTTRPDVATLSDNGAARCGTSTARGGFSYICRIMRAILLLLLSRGVVVFLFATLAACTRPSRSSRTEFVLWTQCTVTLYDHADPAILDAVFQRLHELDARLERQQPRERAGRRQRRGRPRAGARG